MLKGYPPEWLNRINQKSILFEFVSVYTIADIYIEYIEQRIYRVYADLDVYDYYNQQFTGLVCLGDNILLVGGGGDLNVYDYQRAGQHAEALINV